MSNTVARQLVRSYTQELKSNGDDCVIFFTVTLAKVRGDAALNMDDDRVET